MSFSVLETAQVKIREELTQRNSVVISIHITPASSNTTERRPQKRKGNAHCPYEI